MKSIKVRENPQLSIDKKNVANMEKLKANQTTRSESKIYYKL